jgi:putative ABC transport system ATP-binding protein
MMITHNMKHAIDYGNRLLMMDKGEIILDVSGEEKKQLTVDALVKKFHEIRQTEYATDEDLLVT